MLIRTPLIIAAFALLQPVYASAQDEYLPRKPLTQPERFLFDLDFKL
ncbi:hypothetical protein [uncultured Chitinophaga sp.]|jgi:hypothetical protein|nr:hypothetical protein [uncultured Chitinophaga sp.]